MVIGMVEDEAFLAGCSSRAVIDLEIGALAETNCTLSELLRSLAGRRLESLDRLALLTINGDGVVAVLHLIFFISASDY